MAKVYEMTEYRVVTAGGAERLAQEVCKAIKEGWKPQGGCSVVARSGVLDAGQLIYAQALVR